MRVVLSICISLTMFMSAQMSSAQTHPEPHSSPPTFGGVYSRNMELIDVLPRNIRNGDQFDAVNVSYYSGTELRHKSLIISGYQSEVADGHDEVVCLRIIDVTNPRHPNDDYIRIYTRGVHFVSPAPWGNFDISKTYSHPGEQSETTLSGDAFLMAWVGGAYAGFFGGLNLEEPSSRGDDLKARFLALSLNELVQAAEDNSCSSCVFEINDPSLREVSLAGSSSTFHNIYVGYVPSDTVVFLKNYDASKSSDEQIQNSPHALHCDDNAGILTLSPHPWKSSSFNNIIPAQPFIDVFDLTSLAQIPRYTSAQQPTVIQRLSTPITVGNTTVDAPIALPSFTASNNDAWVQVRSATRRLL